MNIAAEIEKGLIRANEVNAKAPDFFSKHGSELLTVGGWLGEPAFSVEEIYQAFKDRLLLELEASENDPEFCKRFGL